MNEHQANQPTPWFCRQTESQHGGRACLPSSPTPSFVVTPCTRNTSTWEAREAPEASHLARAYTFLPGLAESYLARQELPITTDLAILFVDIANSTRILSRQSPARALSVLQHFTSVVTEIALAHCGDVKDYEGDGALLYFTSVTHAASAALAIRAALTARQTSEGHLVRARFSLNVGKVTIGVIGSALRRSVALVGPTVHLAARLLKHVSPSSIIAPQAAVVQLQQEAPALAREFQLWGTCMIVRGFEEQCVTAYHIPPEVVALSDPDSAATGRCRRRTFSPQIAQPLRPQDLSSSPSLSLNPASASEHLFRRGEEYWTLAFEGTVCHLTDSRGLHYLAQLLQHPHKELHALQLVTAGVDLSESDPQRAIQRSEDELNASERLAISRLPDAGEVLAPRARSAYKQRLADLQTELDEARTFHDLARIEQLQEAIAFLTQELAQAVGLGGPARKASSSAERARVNVTRTIRAALKRITENHPVLGRHLTQTIKTGSYCSYSPDPRLPITWRV